VGLQLELERWKAPFAPWARRSPHWDSPIHACSHPENSIYACPVRIMTYKKEDPPPSRVKPVPFPIIAQAVTLCHRVNTPASNTIADMLLLGFFFLLRSSGAMVLLCTKVDTDLICLLGWWRSNEMLRYLHVQTFPIVAPLAEQMLRHGHYSLMHNQPLGMGEQQDQFRFHQILN
jgi:hypothetical protein